MSDFLLTMTVGFYSIIRTIVVYGIVYGVHGSAEELILGYEVCQMKGTLIGVSELTLEKSYQFGLLRIRPL